MRLHKISALAVTGVLIAAGCSGGGSGSSTPSAASSKQNSPTTAQSKATTTIKVRIPGQSKTSADKRQPKWVSPATQGVQVNVFATGQTPPDSLQIATSGLISVAANAPGCNTNGDGSRTCTIVIPAPVGTDDFVFTTYDGGNNPIGTGTDPHQVIASGTSNLVSVTLGGVINSVTTATAAGTPATTFVALADSNPHTVPITVNAADLDGFQILADPYSAPIAVNLTETAGVVPATGATGSVGHTTLTIATRPVGGANTTTGRSGTLISPTDTLSLAYDGLGEPGYFVTVTLTGVGTSPLVSDTFTFDPFYITSTSANFTAAPPTVFLDQSPSDSSATINLAENNPNSTFTATTLTGTATDCTPLLTIGSVSTTSTPIGGTFLLSEATATNGSCTVEVSDGTLSANIAVSTSQATTVITIPPQSRVRRAPSR